MPWRSSGRYQPVEDAQGMETMFNLGALRGGELHHAQRRVAGRRAVACSKLILDAEMQITAESQPVDVSESELAFDAIAGVEPVATSSASRTRSSALRHLPRPAGCDPGELRAVGRGGVSMLASEPTPSGTTPADHDSRSTRRSWPNSTTAAADRRGGAPQMRSSAAQVVCGRRISSSSSGWSRSRGRSR